MVGPLAAAGTIPGVVERAAASYAGRPALVERGRDRDHHLRGALGAGAVGRRRLDRGRGRRRRPRRSLGTQHAGVGHGVACRAVRRRLGRPDQHALHRRGGGRPGGPGRLPGRAGRRASSGTGAWPRRRPPCRDRSPSSRSEPHAGPGVVGGARRRGLLERRLDQRMAALTPGDVSHVQYTSGTTGAPKGAMLRHGAMVETTARWAEVVGLTEGDCYPVVSPFSHIGGHKTGLLACLVAGATAVPVASLRSRAFRADRGRTRRHGGARATDLVSHVDRAGPGGSGRRSGHCASGSRGPPSSHPPSCATCSMFSAFSWS